MSAGPTPGRQGPGPGGTTPPQRQEGQGPRQDASMTRPTRSRAWACVELLIRSPALGRRHNLCRGRQQVTVSSCRSIQPEWFAFIVGSSARDRARTQQTNGPLARTQPRTGNRYAGARTAQAPCGRRGSAVLGCRAQIMPARPRRLRGEIPAGRGLVPPCTSTSDSSDAGLAGGLIGAPSHTGEGRRRDGLPVPPSGSPCRTMPGCRSAHSSSESSRSSPPCASRRSLQALRQPLLAVVNSRPHAHLRGAGEV